LLDNVLDGYNATVFAYGATGCGKTHTITGTVQQPGIIFMTMQELFERISESTGDKVTEISMSYLEIYNETIRDLLAPGTQKGGLMLREDANQAVSVAGLSSHHPQNVQEVMDLILRGNEARMMSPTEANATSSRSHAVLQINVAQKDRNASVDEPHTMATLSIIDLAGSERASATKNRGARLMEGANINKSLLALGSCINALCDPRQHNHVPYRNSKLTRLLKFSLGGNCKTVMIVCVSPSSQHFDETQNTLRYANRAKNIQTKVTRNVYNVNRHVKDFLVKIDEQIALINELKAQQKDYEAIAFAKFRKQNEKKESITREGIARIRSAYEHSVAERQERINNMIKLRHIGRRISMLSSWIAAFDTVCDSLEEEAPMKNMQTVRKTAQGIMLELESGRHHCIQKVNKSTWDRALNSALDHGMRQLQELDIGDNLDASTLSREVELLKANAEREALAAVAEQDKMGEVAMVQVLLQAHFETIAAIENLNRMSVEEAVEAATAILGKMLTSSSNAASHVVKPDGSLAPVEIFAPCKNGTPKRRKHNTSILEESPIRPKAPVPAAIVHLQASPMKASPRRRALLGSAKKGVTFTPKRRKSPMKGMKRAVRWRDDEENGALAEFEKTPQKIELSSDEISVELPPQISELTNSFASIRTNSPGSSPLPAPPGPTMSVVSKNDRFKTGFLAKKSDGSPMSNIMPPPRMTRLSSSDDENSPLREINPTHVQNRPSLAPFDHIDNASATSSSDNENNWKHTPPLTDRADAMKIRSAVKRASSIRSSGINGNTSRTVRRRSPSAATAGSPTTGDMFAAGHVRRMVIGKDSKENEWRVGVLSPRVTGVVTASKVSSSGRRVTMTVTPMGTGERTAHRVSSISGSNHAQGQGHGPRSSLMPGGKGTWR
jgi:kinesin family member 18/19